MRLFFTILSFVISIPLVAQKAGIKKSWTGQNLAFLSIDNQYVYFEIFGRYPENKKYYLSGDTLRLYDKYTSSKDNFSRQHTKNYDFLVHGLTETSLSLTALDSNALQLTGGQKTLLYQERYQLRQPRLDFEWLKFSSTNCFGSCPAMTLQIDKEKKLLFIGGQHALRKGFYTAELTDGLFDSLLTVLKLSDLDNLRTWPQQVADAPEYTLEVQYNGKIKYIRNFFLPGLLRELTGYLLGLPAKLELQESKTPFQIVYLSK